MTGIKTTELLLFILLIFFTNPAYSSEKVSPLSIACFNNDEKSVSALLDHGADLNALSINQLLHCVGSSDVRVENAIRSRLQKNRPVTVASIWDMYSSCDGKTLSLGQGYDEHISLLIDKTNQFVTLGVDINLSDSKGRNSLISASRSCPVVLVKKLIDLGANIDHVSNYKETALMKAAAWNTVDVVNSLINEQNINQKDRNGNTALHMASTSNVKQVADLLIRSGAGVSLSNNAGMTALMLACQTGSMGIVDSLLRAGADVNVADNYGNTSLILAAKANNTEIISALIDAGAIVNKKNNQGETALMQLVSHKNDKATELLLSYGAEIHADVINVSWDVALSTGNLPAIKAWLKNSPDMGLLNEKGDSILHWKNIIKNEEILKILVESGADATKLNSKNETALQHYLNLKNWNDRSYQGRKTRYTQTPDVQTVALLSSACASVIDSFNESGKTALMSVVTNQGIEKIEIVDELISLLINAGADINLLDINGKTNLRNAYPRYIEILIKYGAVVNAIDKKGISELMYLSKEIVGRQNRAAFTAIYFLISAGVDINYQSKAGITALMLAVESGSKDVVEAMLNAGADINMRDNEGRTAWHRSIGQNDNMLFLYLLSKYPDMTTEEHAEVEQFLLSLRFTRKTRDIITPEAKPGKWVMSEVDLFDELVYINKPGLFDAVLKYAPKIYNDERLNEEFYNYKASSNEDSSFLPILIKYGGDINKVNVYGYTPLYYADKDRWNYVNIRNLIKAGASLDARDSMGRSYLNTGRFSSDVNYLKKERNLVVEQCDALKNELPRFVDYDGLILDKINNILWKRCPEGMSGDSCDGSVRTHVVFDAESIALNEKIKNYDNWRLPTIEELQSLYDIDCSALSKGIDRSRFAGVPESGYWSSSRSDKKTNNFYWIDLKNGKAWDYAYKYRDVGNLALQRVWLVHDWAGDELTK